MRQTAWLNAVPRVEAPRNKRLDAPEAAEPVSRLADIKAKGGEPPLPEVEAGAYLLIWFWEVGPVAGGGMAAAPIAHSELIAWQHNTGIELQPWEARLLRRLSQDYVNEIRAAEKPDCPAPYGDPAQEFDRDQIARKVANAFDALAMAQAGPGRKHRKRKP